MKRRTLIKVPLLSVVPFTAGCTGGSTPSDEYRDTSEMEAIEYRDLRMTSDYPDRTVTLDVVVTPDGADRPVFRRRYTLHPGSSVVVGNVLETAGEYTVTVEKHGQETESFRWTVPDDGDLEIRTGPDRGTAILALGRTGVLYGEWVTDPPSGAPVIAGSDDRVSAIAPIRTVLRKLSETTQKTSVSVSGREFDKVTDALHRLPKYTGDDAGYYVDDDGKTVLLTFAVAE